MVENSHNPLFVFLFVIIFFFILLWVDRVFSFLFFFLFSNTPSSVYFTQMTTQRLFIALACHKCKSHNFTERKSLHRHYVKKEKIILPSPPKGNPHYSLNFGLEITKVRLKILFLFNNEDILQATKKTLLHLQVQRKKNKVQKKGT